MMFRKLLLIFVTDRDQNKNQQKHRVVEPSLTSVAARVRGEQSQQ